MSIPTDPTVASIVLSGMKAGGQYSLTSLSTAVTDFIADQFQTIKTELWEACKTDSLLEVEAATVVPVGANSVTLASDFDRESAVWAYDASTPYRGGTAQTGSSTSITLASTFSDDSSNFYGRLLFITSGTGLNQVRRITAYNNTTKIATVDGAWTTTPDSTSVYFIEVVKWKLQRRDHQATSWFSNRPAFYTIVAQSMLIYPAGDQIYPVRYAYYANLTRLDETSTALIKHLRERRALWIQGVKTYTMQRYDDERYPEELQRWEGMKARYAAANVQYDQIEPNR